MITAAGTEHNYLSGALEVFQGGIDMITVATVNENGRMDIVFIQVFRQFGYCFFICRFIGGQVRINSGGVSLSAK